MYFSSTQFIEQPESLIIFEKKEGTGKKKKSIFL